tara:strand:- start:381 stop:512 length:132 start_codon:yes stop_codon:yes gene_type:complete
MAYKQNKITPFTQKKEDKYPEGKPRYFKNLMYKLTGSNKYLQK